MKAAEDLKASRETTCDDRNSQFERIVLEGKKNSDGNLTGNLRKVKDNCADWHNYSQRWNTLNISGSEILKNLMNCKLESLQEVIEDNDEPNSSSTDAQNKAYPNKLQKYCQLLDEVYQQMETLLKKMKRLSRQFKALQELDTFQQQSMNSSLKSDAIQNDSLNNSSLLKAENVVFDTWPMENYYKISEELLDMYAKELAVKQNIVENVAHTTDRDILMFYIATWVHEPYLEEHSKFLIESMLKETGHR